MKLPEGTWAASDEWQCTCPDCGSNKCFINPRKKMGHCKSGSCEWVAYNKKDIYEAFDLDPDDEEEYRGLLQHTSGRRREHGYALTGLVPAWAFPRARAYLQGKRGLTEPAVTKAEIMYSIPTERYVVEFDPYTDDLEPRQAIRHVSGVGKWYPAYEGINLIEYCYGWRYLKPELRGIVLMEGVFDVLATRLQGYSIAMLGTEITPSGIESLAQFERVILWLDPDRAGRKFIRKYLRRIRAMVKEVYVLYERDPKVFRPHLRSLDGKIIKQIRTLCLTEAVHSCKLDLQIVPQRMRKGVFDVYTPKTPEELRPRSFNGRPIAYQERTG